MKIYNSILDGIGSTALIRINRMTADLKCTILAKLESQNPGAA